MSEKVVTKFHAMQLFTDTFIAETVHLTNEEVGIYTRLLNFHWTKNAKPFTAHQAHRICQCKSAECEFTVDSILREFFIKSGKSEDGNQLWSNKRVVEEHQYLTEKYAKRSRAGKLGAIAKHSASGKTMAPIPNPNPKPNKNIYDEHFEELWKKLEIRRGSKFKAFQEYWKLDKHTGCTVGDILSSDEIATIYNAQQKGIEDKFVPHFSTWLSQKRWEMEEIDQIKQESPVNLRQKMEKLGFTNIFNLLRYCK